MGYWEPLESTAETVNLNDFFRYHTAIKSRNLPSSSKVYEAFRDLQRKDPLGTEERMSDLLHYGKLFEIIKHPERATTNHPNALEIFARLKTNTAIPFLMDLLMECKNGNLDEDEAEKCILLTEGYLVRRELCGFPTEGLNKLFVAPGNQTVTDMKNHSSSSCLEALSHRLIRKLRGGNVMSASSMSGAIRMTSSLGRKG